MVCFKGGVFREIYDNEWTQAFEDLERTSKHHGDENKLVDALADVVKVKQKFKYECKAPHTHTI